MSIAVNHLVIAEDAWKPTGDYPEAGSDPTARLTADVTLTINGTPMFVQAYAIDREDPKFPDEQHVVDQELDGILSQLVGDGAFPLHTTVSGGREYIVVVTPYGA
jgi:hypothetical protein